MARISNGAATTEERRRKEEREEEERGLMRHVRGCESVDVARKVTPWSLVALAQMARLLHKSRQLDWRDSKGPDLEFFWPCSFLEY
jgi:hypothetical protein